MGPTPGDHDQHQPDAEHGQLYCIRRMFDRDGQLLFLEHGSGTSDERPWLREVALVSVHHMPPGATEAETSAHWLSRVEIEQPRYNREADSAFDEDAFNNALVSQARLRSEARRVHQEHDGVVRELRAQKPLDALETLAALAGDQWQRLAAVVAGLLVLTALTFFFVGFTVGQA